MPRHRFLVSLLGKLTACILLCGAPYAFAQKSAVKAVKDSDLMRVPLMVSEEISDDLRPRPLPPETRGVLCFSRASSRSNSSSSDNRGNVHWIALWLAKV